MNAVNAAWLAEIILIAMRDWQGKGTDTSRRLPWPSELLATFILFGTLSLAPEGEWSTAAAALGWGFVAATYLGIYTPGRKVVGPASAQATVPATSSPAGSSGALQPATPQQLGGPLGAGLFLPGGMQ